MDEHDADASAAGSAVHTTAQLLLKVRGGDLVARERLFDRHRPELVRWAHGRLPRALRDVRDTDDLVQDALVRALGRLGDFEPQHDGSFLAYLCHILNNLVRDEMRAARRRPGHDELGDDLASNSGTPDEQFRAAEALARYRRGMQKLSADQRDALVMRLELGLPYEAIAEEMGRTSENAVRLLVSRGLERLTRLMEQPSS